MKNSGYMAKRCAAAVMAAVLGFLLAAQGSAVALAAGQVKGASYGEYRSGSAAGGGTTQEGLTVVEINREEDLRRLAEDCSLDAWSADKLVRLNADITLQEETEIVIPSFRGIFEGNHHRITNLHIDREGSGLGLFRYLQEGGVIRNLRVEGRVAPQGSQSQAGGIVGCNYGLIYNCSFSGTVEGDNEVGGIAGRNGTAGEIRKCTSQAVILGNHSTGGIAGNNLGVLNNCANEGDINTYSLDVSYELADITVENLEDINAASNVSAHTDSGGIAGISSGKIYYCTNRGTVGSPHIGYNTGGIAGRLSQGYIQNCTNSGHILGRKDVGGITGQMEPFLEIQYLDDKLSQLDAELDITVELMARLHGNMRGFGSQASALSKQITTNLKNISAAAGTLISTGDELWYLYNQELTGAAEDLKALGGEIGDITVSAGDTRDIIYDMVDQDVDGGSGEGSSKDRWELQKPGDLEAYKAALEKFGGNTGKHLETIAAGSADRKDTVSHSLNVINMEMEAAGDSLGQLADILQASEDQTGRDVDDLLEQARVLRRLMSDIRDDLFSYEGITVKDTSDESAGGALESPGSDLTAAEGEAGLPESGDLTREEEDKLYDTSSFQKGKVTLCLNNGLVEADTNVGGIVGQVATEFDFDPEDDITLTGAESFDVERTVKAVIRESRNLGAVTGKKDYAGGIVGKADFGAVISCESYGDITSTDGSYVGGIAGSSSYAVRGCYTLGALSGRNYVGGIAGSGCDIFYSVSLSDITVQGEGGGAIAGKAKEDGILHENCYVADRKGVSPGIDGIGYTCGAAPVTYDTLCLLENLPDAFTAFTITFQVDGQQVGSFTCGYGESLPPEQIPAIPEREGYYGRWPEFDYSYITGNKVLEAQYEKFTRSLASKETDEGGLSLLLAEGEFLPGAELIMEQDGNTITYSIVNDGEAYQEPVRVRVLAGENASRLGIEVREGESDRKAETSLLGQYIVFSMEQPGTFRMVEPEDQDILLGPIICAAAVVVLTAALLARNIAARKRRKETHEADEQQSKKSFDG